MIQKHLKSSQEKLANFGYGEWVEEPDDVEFEHLGIRCRILRNFSGSLCGYSEVPKGHPWYGMDYMKVPVEVHCGLTFGEEWVLEDKIKDSSGYWIGFDCAHANDIVPTCERTIVEVRTRMSQRHPWLKDYVPLFQRTYKNINFCVQECKSMAEQINKASLAADFQKQILDAINEKYLLSKDGTVTERERDG